MSPQRIQRRRTKGWRMPEGAVYVGRPTVWGNNHKVGDSWEDFWWDCGPDCFHMSHRRILGPRGVVYAYRSDIGLQSDEETRAWLAPLRGKDLACWCPILPEGIQELYPCHADVLLELANR